MGELYQHFVYLRSLSKAMETKTLGRGGGAPPRTRLGKDLVKIYVYGFWFIARFEGEERSFII